MCVCMYLCIYVWEGTLFYSTVYVCMYVCKYEYAVRVRVFIIWLTDFECCDWSIPGP